MSEFQPESAGELEPRTYRVGFAVTRLDDGGLIETRLASALEESWQPGNTVTRYGRRWTLSRIHSDTGREFTGQIGFVGENETDTLEFNYERGEFVKHGVPTGVIVPFAIRKSDGLTVFQLRSGLVREASFTGALANLLNVTPNAFLFHVDAAVRQLDFERWKAETAKVTGFSFRLERPNPDYKDRELVEGIIEDIRVEHATLSGKAMEDGDVNVDADLFTQSLDHVLREYGRAAVTGTGSDGKESTWVKIKGWPASVRAQAIVTAVGPPEIPEEPMIGALRDEEKMASVDLGGIDDEL